jgi:predicted nucleic acid-binding protein
MLEKGALLDTSFLIRLLNSEDKLHENAMGYFRYLLRSEIPLFVSTIAVAEYCVKGDFSSIPWRNVRVVPFNLLHAKVTAKLCEVAFRKKEERGAHLPQRLIIPNDTKMFAQAHQETGIGYFLSSDSEAKKVYDLINSDVKLHFQFIDIIVPYANTFGVLL